MKTREKVLCIPFCPIPSMITLWPYAAFAQNFLSNLVLTRVFIIVQADKQSLNKQNTSIIY